MLWDFDRKMASPTESAVRLDQAVREHSGAGILNTGPSWRAMCQRLISRDTRLTFVTCQEWSFGFCMEPFSMRVVPRSTMRDAFLAAYDVPSRSM